MLKTTVPRDNTVSGQESRRGVMQKQSRGNQFLKRFLAKKSRSNVEQQQREIKEEWFESGWQKDFREGNRNSEGFLSSAKEIQIRVLLGQ